MSLEVTYRYVCSQENTHVEEVRAIGAAAPSVCKNDNAALVAGTLAIVDHPDTFDDVGFFESGDVDFSNANISGLSHTALTDIGTNTHAQIDAHIAANNNPHNVTASQVGLGDVPNLKANLAASDAPTANNDSSDGYAVGSVWIDTSNDKSYQCVDVSVGAAVWKQVTAGQYDSTTIDAHINNADLHRTIDDASTAATSLWSASKIGAELAGKADAEHTHTASDISDFNSATDARVAAQKGEANGVASLDANAKIPTSQLPSLAITDVHVVANIAARDALTVESGDVAKVNDSDGNNNPQTYIWDGSAWIEIQETSDVISVNGQTGVVSLTTTDVEEGSNLYYTTARFDSRLTSKSTSDLTEGSNLYYTDARVSANGNVSANSTHRARTDNPHSVTKAQVGLGNVANLKMNLTAGSAPTASADSNAGYDVGSLWIDTTNDVAYRCVDATASNAVWRASTGGGHLSATGNFSTTSNVYMLVQFGSVLFAAAGTRTILNVKAVAQLTTASGGYTFDMRLVDISNSDAVLAEVTGVGASTKQVFSLGTVSNVPTSGDSILELQVRRSGTVTGPERIIVYSLDIEYA